jgi:hypothetical protein
MATRSVGPTGPGNQDRPLNWAAPQFLVRRFRSALLEIAGVFRGRADARFNDLARPPHEVDVRMQWTSNIIGMVRAQLYAAADQGPDEKAETIRRVRRMCKELEFCCLNGFVEEPGVQAVPKASLDFTKEAGEAMLAVQTYRETGSESDAERARRELQDVIEISEDVIDLASRRRPIVQVMR